MHFKAKMITFASTKFRKICCQYYNVNITMSKSSKSSFLMSLTLSISLKTVSNNQI